MFSYLVVNDEVNQVSVRDADPNKDPADLKMFYLMLDQPDESKKRF